LSIWIRDVFDWLLGLFELLAGEFAIAAATDELVVVVAMFELEDPVDIP
jgi:hypothetical protein